MSGAVDLGTWPVEELLAAGFDRLGAVQPLLRPQLPEADREAVREALAERGDLERRGGRWQPVGDLRVLLSARAEARLTVVVTGVAGPPLLLLGRFGGGDGVLQVRDDGERCAAALRTRADVAADLAGLLPDGPDGPLLLPDDPAWDGTVRALGATGRSLTLDGVLVGRDGVRTALRLGVVGTDQGSWLVSGVRDDEHAALEARAASRASVAAAVADLLGGDRPRLG